jgi:hypothetical protein
MSKTFPKAIDKNKFFDVVSFSWTFFVFAVSGVSPFSAMGDGSSKALQKTYCQYCKTNGIEKFLQKIRPKIQNRFFLGFVYHVFGRVSVRGVQKHHSDPGLWSFLGL